MTDAEYMKAALKELGEKFTVELANEWIAARKKLDSIGEGEEPETEPAEEPAPEAPMSADEPDKVAAGDETEPEVEASDAPEVEAQGEPPEGGADEAAKEAIVSALVSASGGKSLAEIAAAIQERPDDFAALLGGAPADGTPADQGAMSDDTVNNGADAAVSLLTKQVERLAQRLEAQEAKEREAKEAKAREAKLSARREIEAEVDRFVAASLIDAADRDRYVKLASDSPDSYKVLAAPLRKLAGDKTPPTGTLYQGGGHAETRTLSDADPDEERYLRATLAQTGVKDIDGAVLRHFAAKNGSRG